MQVIWIPAGCKKSGKFNYFKMLSGYAGADPICSRAFLMTVAYNWKRLLINLQSDGIQSACQGKYILSAHAISSSSKPFFADGYVEKPCCRLLPRRFFALPSTKNEPPKC